MGPKKAQFANWDEAAALLGVSQDAGDEALRAAYLDKIRRHPPDREPELFERIRDAYDQLRDPAARARMVLEGPNPAEPLSKLIGERKATRKFVGPRLWTDLMKEGRA